MDGIRLGSLLLICSLLPGLSGCASFRPCEMAAPGGGTERTIYVVRHGWHTGIVVAVEDAGDRLAFLAPNFPGANYYELGWGDRAFYTEEEAHSGLALRALFWPTDAVIHVVGLQHHPGDFAHDGLVELEVTAAGLSEMIHAVADAFVPGPDRSAEAIGEGLYGESRFFDAHGTFWLGNTCNTWTVGKLRRAGVPVRPWSTITAGSVMRQACAAAKRCGDAAQPARPGPSSGTRACPAR